MTRTDYTVVYELAADGYWNAYGIDLPVVANADSREAIEVRIREAIEFHLETLRLDGEELPRPHGEVGTVEVSVPA